MLRDYQTRAVESARACFRAGSRAVLLVAPTGSGKTIIGAEIARLHHGKRGQVVWLAHRIELVKQAVEKLQRAGISDVGCIAADGGFNESAPVVVCSIQTLLARPEARPQASLLIADEAHHYVSAEWSKLMAHYQGQPVVGLTATPQRADGTALGAMFDSLVEVATVAELVAAGHLEPITVIAPAKRLAGTELADPIAALAKHAPGRKAVVFAANVPHGRSLAADLGAGYLDGNTPADERAELLAAFEAGRLRVLVNVFVLTEGWDCPSVEVCVLARGCGSAAAFLQMVGRIRRRSPGKRGCLLIDCKGAVHQHGMPDDARVYSLHGRPITTAKELPGLRQCPACGAVYREMPECPRCSYATPPALPAVSRAELVRVDHATPEATKRAFFRAQLEQARRSNKKPGWAMHRFRWRFGYWPPQQWIGEMR
jgi:superfamily II DNA or RNA helicase